MEVKPHILLIEDSQTQAKAVSLYLGKAGYQVSHVDTGQKGLKFAEEIPLDLILLDVVLPDTDGFTLCNQLRQSITSYTPILMLTQERVSVEDKVEGLKVGADDYLNKPFDIRELLARVNALLRVKRLINDLLGRLDHEQQAYQTLRRMALTDQLTGLYNRHYFNEELEREYSLFHRYGMPLSCIMSDIDDFRNFNTTHGHIIGDWVLRGAAGLMKNNLRDTDIISRYGGDEFVILLPMSNIEEAGSMAERLRDMVDKQKWSSPVGDLKVTISLGVASTELPMISQPIHLVECADKALFQSKSLGRNQVNVYQTNK